MSTKNVTIRKILLLRFSSLGDIVMTTPMIRAVRRTFPHAQIDMVVRDDFIDLIRCNPHLDRKIAFPRQDGLRGLLRLLATLRREGYDLIYDAHRSIRTMLLMPGLRRNHACYFKKHYVRRNASLMLKLPWLGPDERFLTRFIEPMKHFGVEFDNKGPEIFLDDAWENSAREKSGLKISDDRFIGIIASAQWPGKRWPTDYFRLVVQNLIGRLPHTVLIFGGKGDHFCQEIASGLPRVVNLQGKLSIGESAALLRKCALTIANDTGLMHMADALGVPSVLILGPTSGELGCLPFHPLTQVLEHRLWCRPCSKNGQAPCIRRERVCLTKTTAADVCTAIDSVLAGCDQHPSTSERRAQT